MGRTNSTRLGLHDQGTCTLPDCTNCSKLESGQAYTEVHQRHSSLQKPIRPHVADDIAKTKLDLEVYVDSDWAGCTETRKSTTGVIIKLLGCCVMALSRTQNTRALSSGEAELYAIGTGTCEALHLRNFLIESKLAAQVNVLEYTDSTAGKAMASRFGTSKKTRHVALKYLFVQDLVTEGVIQLKKVLGTLNPADVCTKAVDYNTLQRHLSALGIYALKGQVTDYIESTLSTIRETCRDLPRLARRLHFP